MGVATGPRVPDGPDGNPIVSVEYELFGLVQGVFFQKYAKEVAEQLSIGGWIKNTKQGTIVGRLQGLKNSLQQMLEWMVTEGSPGSRVEKLDLSKWEFTAMQDFKNFSIRF
ncbi:acylphosphatase-2 [Folsomia candida]|uniref:acylphosphatase n=1 Tax=Folsomia candida TaxID=158441 RepID=A0A226EPK2_FOLCA|nr:acylphosphatase-2 [Folsomia candida]OXA59220.1 Acylphosphatase-2 [Folsomia candida]